MRISKSTLTVAISLLVFFGAIRAQSKNIIDWIEPLKFTRAQVEKEIGPAITPSCQRLCVYQTPIGKLTVSYSESRCRALITGWNVKKNVVVSFSLVANGDTLRAKYEQMLRIHSAHDIVVYKHGARSESRAFQNTGLVFDFDTVSGDVEVVHKFPSMNQSSFRCRGFPSYHPVGSIYAAQLNYYESDVNGILQFLDSANISARSGTGTSKTYVLVYRTMQMKTKPYARLIKAMRDHVHKTLGLSSSDIEIIDGGKRNKFAVDLYVLSVLLPAPFPQPDFPISIPE